MPQIISVRELRKALAFHMNGQEAIIIGDRWHHRALLVPLSRAQTWDRPEMRKAIARAAKETLAALGALRKENRA